VRQEETSTRTAGGRESAPGADVCSSPSRRGSSRGEQLDGAAPRPSVCRPAPCARVPCAARCPPRARPPGPASRRPRLALATPLRSSWRGTSSSGRYGSPPPAARPLAARRCSAATNAAASCTCSAQPPLLRPPPRPPAPPRMKETEGPPPLLPAVGGEKRWWGRRSRMPRCAASRRGRREGRARRRYCSPRWEAGSGGRGVGRGSARVADAEIRRDEGVGARVGGEGAATAAEMARGSPTGLGVLGEEGAATARELLRPGGGAGCRGRGWLCGWWGRVKLGRADRMQMEKWVRKEARVWNSYSIPRVRLGIVRARIVLYDKMN
jgi:hypothetical protein